jgi:hypothetical protein
MPRIDFDSEIMKRSACLKDSSDKSYRLWVCTHPLIPYYFHTFSTSYDMLGLCPERGYFSVPFFFLRSKFPFLFLQRLYNGLLRAKSYFKLGASK